MSHYEWTELDYVAGAAHDLHMSYGQYVAMGCPNLHRFKRRVENGEFDLKPKSRRRIKLKGGVSPAGRKIETTITCKQCSRSFTYIRFGGPVKTYCPECGAKRASESSKAAHERRRDREKHGMGGINS